MTVPDSVPSRINEIALKTAAENNCDGIRILLAISLVDSSTYFISFFTDEAGIKKEIILTTNGVVENLSEADRDYLNGLLKKKSLAKATGTCWDLAHFWVNANYSGDPNFQFSQETYGIGYYHKVINRLGSPANCCAGNFPGGMNNLVSSHQWSNQTKDGYSMVVDRIQVWDGTYRSGNTRQFTGTSAYHDSNWSDDEWCWWVPWPPFEDCESIDNKVSSLDMMYHVYD